MAKISRRTLLEKWWLLPVGATASAFGFMGWYARRVSRKEKALFPHFEAHSPQRLCAPTQLSRPWDSLDFSYAGRPCILLRLPQATMGGLEVLGGHFAAFDRTCTHLGCPVNLIRDQEVLAFSFNYRPPAKTPQLGCPCHFSVFDPLSSGEAVFGKARLPLARVRLEARGGFLWATGLERGQQTG